MTKQSILTNKKILWASAGVLLTSGVIAGVLVPILTSKDNSKEKDTKMTLTQTVLNAKSSDDTITAMQKLYGLENKKAVAVNDFEAGELKTQYQSASNLATFIFANKNTYQTLFVQGKEQTTNLQEIVLIMTPKNHIRKQKNNGEWPSNQINAKDQFNFLITFLKEKVVKVTKLNAKTVVTNAAKIFFKVKAYDLVNLFYQFKNADPQAIDFGYYNNYLDDKNNTQGLAFFKKYLLTLKARDSVVTVTDLTEVQFTKKSHNVETKTATIELRFSYQGLSTTKTINDFHYKEAYKLTLKTGVNNKMADEVQIADIDTTNLPAKVTISGVKPSTENADGSVIQITFNGGKITSQVIIVL